LSRRGAGPDTSRDDPAALLQRFRDALPRDVREAARIAVRTIRAARAAGDKVHELRGYWALSSAAALGRRPRMVLAVVERALACDAAREDEALRARTTLGRGSALIHFGRLDDVRREVGEALPALRRARDARGQAMAHGLLAAANLESGRHAEAAEHLVQERAALGVDASAFALASNEDAEAQCRVALFDFAGALALFESARARYRSVDAGLEAARTRFNCAYLHLKSGRFADALRLYSEVSESFDQERNESLLHALHVDRAELLLELGAVAESRRSSTVALASSPGVLSRKDALRARRFVAAAALQDGDAVAAMEAASLVAAEFERLSDPCGVAESLVVCSAAALAQGLSEQASRCADAATEQFDMAGAGAAACEADFAKCRAALASGAVDDASAALDRAAARDGIAALPWASIELLRHRAMVLNARGDFASAAGLLNRATRELDARRGLLPPDALRSAFLSLHAPLHREAVDAHVRLGRTERAFELAAASKSRALLDLIASGGNVDGAASSRLDGLRTELGAVYARLHELSLRPRGESELAVALATAARIERDMAEVVTQSFNRGAGEETLRPAQTSDELRASLRDDEALIEYAFGAHRLHAFVATRDRVRYVALDVDESAVASRLRKFTFHLTEALVDRDAAAGAAQVRGVRANLEALRRMLVDPLDLPARARRVIVAPDRALHGVPFHAMPAGDGWWADDVQILYAPSALLHATCVRARADADGPPHVFAAPDDDVPEILTEARVVAQTLGPRTVVRTGPDATWTEFVASAGKAGLLHVATHGMSRTDSVVGGSVRLADGWLTQYDLYRIRVRADLVVLSACDSGATRHEASGDPFGLVRGFLCAGARTLVVSRWRVDDRTTAEWMGAFYGALASGRCVGDAYLAACGAVRAAHPHPFHWAPFVLTGDARRTFSF
jgi:CHAT domain-containing protein